jgi:hypothetical protein
MTLPAAWKPGRNSADNKERAVDEAKTYADFGIPGLAPCPSWCSGSYAGSRADPARAVIFHAASAIGGAVLVDGHAVTLGVNWVERFADGEWQPPRGEDVTVFLQVGMDYIPVDATDRNMAGLAAIARLISPDVDDRVRQIGQLLKETHDTRQAGPDDAR